MDAIVLKALEKDPANRYQTAKEMADDITRLLTGQQVTALIQMPPVTDRAVAAEPTQLLTNPTGPQGVIGARALTPEEGDYEPEDGRSRKSLIILIASLAAVLVAIAGGLLWWMTRPEEPPAKIMLEVPYLKDLDQAAAQKAIDDLNAQCDEAHQPDGCKDVTLEVLHDFGPNNDTKGKVTRQEPGAKVEIEEGEKVTVWVNDGPEQKTIPAGLIGMNKADAEAALKEAGLTNYKIDPAPLDRYPYQSTYQPDNIVDCSPAPGSQVSIDTQIQLYYDSGNGILPNVMGLDQATATRELTKAGFENVVYETSESTSPQGTVVAMDPGPDPINGIPRSSQITIWTAIPVVVPTTEPSTEAPPAPSASASP